MNNEQKLEMINMCTTALLEGKHLEYFDDESWVESDNDIGDIVCNIVDYDTQYRVKPEPEPKKFVPSKGQIGYVYDANREHRRLYKFLRMHGDRYCCTQMDDLDADGADWENFEPIPGLVQFRPMSELDPKYEGGINIQLENGQIEYYAHVPNLDVSFNENFEPCGFQLLEE